MSKLCEQIIGRKVAQNLRSSQSYEKMFSLTHNKIHSSTSRLVKIHKIDKSVGKQALPPFIVCSINWQTPKETKQQ